MSWNMTGHFQCNDWLIDVATLANLNHYSHQKWVCHCWEHDIDSWGDRSQMNWTLLQNNESALSGLTNCQRQLQQSHLAHQNHQCQWRGEQTLRHTLHREGWTVLLLTLWVGVSLSRRCERRCEIFSNGMLVTQGTPFAERKGVVSSPDRQGRRARAQKKIGVWGRD